MDVILCMIGLMIVSLYAFHQLLQIIADDAEYRRRQAEQNRKPILIVEKKGKGWELLENDTDN